MFTAVFVTVKNVNIHVHHKQTKGKRQTEKNVYCILYVDMIYMTD